MGFPKRVNTDLAFAVAGDFASANTNKFTFTGGPEQFIAGAAGVTVAAFCWLDAANGNAVDSFGVGSPIGFISRQGLRADIVTPGPGYPDASMTILAGSYLTLYNAGDFWVVNNGTAATAFGQKAYANNQNGLISFGATGSPPQSATDTGATLTRNISATNGGALPVANTATVSIAASVGGALPVMTVSAVGAGSVLASGVGQTVSAATIDPNTQIIAQLSGTAGGAGTYSVSISQTVPAGTAATLSGGGLTLTGGNTSGTFAPGMTISGTNVPTGTTILAYGTGTAGGAGTYLVDRPAVTAATASTITAANAMLLTVSGASVGTWGLDDIIAGTTVSANQSIVANGVTNPNLTGLGGAGTYLTNVFQAALTAQTISVYSGVETKYWCYDITPAAVGELSKMSSTAPS